jgi:hypothetical protein
MKRSATVALAAVALAFVRPARADLRELASRVADAYRAAGARVVVLQPKFLYDDETLVLVAPSADGARCTKMAIVGARGLSFHVGEGEEDSDHRHDDDGHVYSVAGALEIDSCDVKPTPVRVRSDAGRGAIEVVVAFSQAPLPGLRAVLPERVGGAMPAMVDPGPVPAMPPPEKRAEAAESAARRDGAAILPRAMATASADGAGVVHVRLDRGCHRIELFSPESFGGRRKTRLDLDAELHEEAGDVLLARDRGEAADARLDVCAGERKETLLSFGGALAGAPIIIARATWPTPTAVPTIWGSDASRRFAGALRVRHVTPTRTPVALYEGIVGSSSFVVPVEPGACYVAVAAATRGVPRGLVLRAVVGSDGHADERGTGDGAALVSFCTTDRDRARVTVEARGTSLAWGTAIYRMTSGGWEHEP